MASKVNKRSLSTNKDKEELVRGFAEETLSLLGTGGEVVVSKDEENEAFSVQIESDEAGILIGRHGDTIDALQTLLSQMIYQKTGEQTRVLVNIEDYRERREESLNGLANSVAARAKETGQDQQIYDLKPNERRIVHMALSEDDGVVTESQGEGRDRYLEVKLKKVDGRK